MKNKTITVTVEGGLIQEVYDIPPGIIVKILDYDIEGADPKRITKLEHGQEVVESKWKGKQLSGSIGPLKGCKAAIKFIQSLPYENSEVQERTNEVIDQLERIVKETA